MTDDLLFYTHPMSRGRIVRWMLEEVGCTYRTEILDYATTLKAPAYLAINPMGKIPAIAHKGVVVTECAAICAYLADAFPDAGLAPATTDPARAAYYRWLFFAAGPIEASVTNQALGVVVPPDRKRMAGYGSFDDVLATLESAVTASEYLGRAPVHRRRPLCRVADRLRADVRLDPQAPRVRELRRPARGTARGGASPRDRRRADRRGAEGLQS